MSAEKSWAQPAGCAFLDGKDSSPTIRALIGLMQPIPHGPHLRGSSCPYQPHFFRERAKIPNSPHRTQTFRSSRRLPTYGGSSAGNGRLEHLGNSVLTAKMLSNRPVSQMLPTRGHFGQFNLIAKLTERELDACDGDGGGVHRGGCVSNICCSRVDTSAGEGIWRWNGTESTILAAVISLNLKRRHLIESQRAMVAAKLANLGEGRPSHKTPPIGGLSQNDAAKLLKVGVRTVQLWRCLPAVHRKESFFLKAC